MYRSHTCGELNLSNVGTEVTLSGWVQVVRDKGFVVYIDLRDRYGITQLIFDESRTEKSLLNAAKNLGREYVIQVRGQVIERENKNPNIPTGDIELLVSELNLLSKSDTPPFTIIDETDGSEELRMKYRYLDIRRPKMRDRLIMRHRLYQEVRSYLSERQFIEVETPYFIKSTPEGARDFLVPSRLNKGSFYALPQSPQILKQLLMVSGMDRYFQIVKCFRDEDFRGDRQPEFTQIDCEMSFVTQEDVLTTFEGLTRHVYEKLLGVSLAPFARLSYHEAIRKYGSDKPDLRFGCEIVDLTLPESDFPLAQKAKSESLTIAGICCTGLESYSRKQIDALIDFVKEPNRGLGGLIWIKWGEEGLKSSVDKFYTPEQLSEIAHQLKMKTGDMGLIAIDKDSKVRKSLGDLRLHLAKSNGWIDPTAWSILWIIDFPLFELDEATGQTVFVHHPFCNPNPEDLKFLKTDPLKVRGELYDLVINGNEILSGSIRIHNQELQNTIFEILGLSEEEKNEKFGFFVNALKYGTPPHGGCAFGLDRWVMLMTGGETIRDVIAFPKNNSGRDLMMDAPAPVDSIQLDDLALTIVQPKDNKL